MNDSMAGRNQAAFAAMAFDPGEKPGEKRFMSQGFAGRPTAFGKKAPFRIGGAETRRRSDAFDFPLADKGQIITGTELKECELEAR
jgi:hypothetical protein